MAILIPKINIIYFTSVSNLACLRLAHHEWCGERRLGVLLEGHGRWAFESAVDVSHTVGWFAAMWPVVLELSEQSGTLSKEGVGAAICLVKRPEPASKVPSASPSQDALSTAGFE